MAADFWKRVWNSEIGALGIKTRYLLSLANAVGGGHFRQAARELIKAYAVGLSVEEMDEIFILFAWNQGIGNFVSGIGPSPLFGAYKLIKENENKSVSKEEISKKLLEKFGEGNPGVGTQFKNEKD